MTGKMPKVCKQCKRTIKDRPGRAVLCSLCAENNLKLAMVERSRASRAKTIREIKARAWTFNHVFLGGVEPRNV